MMARGRGRGFGGRPRGPARPVARFMSRPTFDPVLAEPAFPRVKPLPEENDFNQDLLNLNTQLSPTEEEEAAINNLMTKVRSHLDKFILAPAAESSCQIEEVRPVGSFKKGTMMRGSNVADLVVILKSMPARQAVDVMGMKLCQELNEQDAKLTVSFTSNERGFTLFSGAATVRIMIATVPANMKKLDSSLHLEYKVLQQNMAAVRQCRWFEESAHHSSIRVLIRVLKHLKNRYELLSPLTPWIIDLLAHYCIMNHPNRQIVPLPAAFRRALQLMAAGLFLPGSQGLIDPVESYGVRAHTAIPVAQQDGVTIAAQTLLQILAYGGYQPVLGLDGSSKDLTTEVTVWNGVVVTPGEEAYVPTPENEEGEPQDVEMKAPEE